MWFLYTTVTNILVFDMYIVCVVPLGKNCTYVRICSGEQVLIPEYK